MVWDGWEGRERRKTRERGVHRVRSVRGPGVGARGVRGTSARAPFPARTAIGRPLATRARVMGSGCEVCAHIEAGEERGLPRMVSKRADDIVWRVCV